MRQLRSFAVHTRYLALFTAFLATSTACSDESSPSGASGTPAGSGAATSGAGGSGAAGSSGVGGGGSGATGGAGGADATGSSGVGGGGSGATGGAGGADATGSTGAAGGPHTEPGPDGPGEDGAALGFFVSTPSDSGGDLGGIAGADATCQALAAEVGAGHRTWRAYLSTSTENARDRIGKGPWVNAKGVTVAANLEELHALPGGDPDLFLDHRGDRINGQWAGSPTPLEHDILTGSAKDGTALASTCDDWTSSTATPGPQVGHSDGLGPGMNGGAPYNSWNSVHAPAGCSQQQLVAVGGAGRFYCFAAD
ncbi:hypothetical protein WMF31_41325 [Sorangium sp. So ce1036]|uniref:hypothetical protein n=1 Tax=Sorangium sp. So ce1036 TaxID=3133328 RepID=UPI003F119841